MVTNIMSMFNRTVASMEPEVPQVMKLVPQKVPSLSTVMLSLHRTAPLGAPPAGTVRKVLRQGS